MRTSLVVDHPATIRAAIRGIAEAVERLAGSVGGTRERCTAGGPLDAVPLDADTRRLDGPGVLAHPRGDAPGPQPPSSVRATPRSVEIQRAVAAGADPCIMTPFEAEISGGKLAANGVAA